MVNPRRNDLDTVTKRQILRTYRCDERPQKRHEFVVYIGLVVVVDVVNDVAVKDESVQSVEYGFCSLVDLSAGPEKRHMYDGFLISDFPTVCPNGASLYNVVLFDENEFVDDVLELGRELE